MYVNGQQLIDEYYNESPIKQDRPVIMEAGKPVKVRLVYRQTRQSGKIQLKWQPPLLRRNCSIGLRMTEQH